jgi:hypothetical protein
VLHGVVVVFDRTVPRQDVEEFVGANIGFVVGPGRTRLETR